ncbi:MAG: FHIPEP family type III secretion protein [Candidatus Eremiobacteraeota bacterium]|nr:FHIPEP family type III secretion protein [Candidatus Eremiobacteraeota bacterium]
MEEPEHSKRDTSEPEFGEALSEITKNLQWEKMISDGGSGREILSLTLRVEDRFDFLRAWKTAARDFALDTGVLLPSVSFQDGTGRELAWGERRLGSLQSGKAGEILEVLKEHAWRFLSIRQVEARLKKLWEERPELHRTFQEVDLTVSRTVRILRDLIRSGYSIKNFGSVMESLILARSQYSSHSDLVHAVEVELGNPTSRQAAKTTSEKKPSTPEGYFTESRADEITVQLGRGILDLVDPLLGKPLFERVESIRMSLARELGLVIPGVHFTDDLRLNPKEFRFLIRDEEVFRAEVHPELLMAIGPDHIVAKIRGVRTQDPIYGMPALWITPELRGESENSGCMVFTPESVVGSALVETLRKQAGRLFTYGYLSEGVLKSLKGDEPALVQYFESSPKLLRTAKLVFSNLLEERVPVRDQIAVLETVVEYEEKDLSAEHLTEIVRRRLGGTICKLHLRDNGPLAAVVLSKPLEDLCLECLNEEKLELEPDEHQRRRILQSFKLAVEALRDRGLPEVLITAPNLRRAVRGLIERNIPTLAVLSEAEIPAGFEVVCLGEVASRMTRPPTYQQPFPRGRRNKTRFAKWRSTGYQS